MVKGHSWGDRCQLYQVVVLDEIEMWNHQRISDSEHQRITLTLACPMDLKNFPMDVQTCIMQLESCESLA